MQEFEQSPVSDAAESWFVTEQSDCVSCVGGQGPAEVGDLLCSGTAGGQFCVPAKSMKP